MNGLALGVMTGTSVDAVDTALIMIEKGKPKSLEGFYSNPFTKNQKKEIVSLQQPGTNEIERYFLASNKLSSKISTSINFLLSEKKNYIVKRRIGNSFVFSREISLVICSTWCEIFCN